MRCLLDYLKHCILCVHVSKAPGCPSATTYCTVSRNKVRVDWFSQHCVYPCVNQVIPADLLTCFAALRWESTTKQNESCQVIRSTFSRSHQAPNNFKHKHWVRVEAEWRQSRCKNKCSFYYWRKRTNSDVLFLKKNRTLEFLVCCLTVFTFFFCI